MKKGQLLSILLWGSMGCAVNINLAVAASSSSLPENKSAESSHKKTAKRSSSAARTRRMTEKDISECTVLLDKVAQADKAIQKDMMSMSTTNNSKISEHLKKSADTQIFASDDPVAIAHLTGKSAKLPAQQSSKGLVPLTAMPVPTSRFAPPPVFKPTTATLVATASKTSKYVAPSKRLPTLPPNTQVFASNDPKAIAHLTGKVTPPLSETIPRQPERLLAKPMTSKPLVAKPVVPDKPVSKPLAAKPVSNKAPVSHPRIELFAPNSPDLNHLEGKSANLADFQKLADDKKSAHKSKQSSTKKKPS